MATATTNKLPEFATKPQDNTFDTEIIDKSSELENTGFVPNTTIRSSQMNTYMKMMIESLRGIVDGLYRQAANQHQIKANSTALDWQNYIQKGLDDLIINTKVNVSALAEEALKLQTPRKISLTGDVVGNANFDGSSNIEIQTSTTIANAKSMVNNTGGLIKAGGVQRPVYFSDGKPVPVNMFTEVGTYFLTKQSNGKYTALASDVTHFLAFVEVGDTNGNICLSGIAEFYNGAPTGMMSGSFMLYQTGSNSTAFVNTKVYSTNNPVTIHVEGQAVKFDCTISDDVNYRFIRITKLYQIN